MSESQLRPQAVTYLDAQTLETSFRDSTETWDFSDWQIAHEAGYGGPLKLHLVLPIWLVLVGADLESVTTGTMFRAYLGEHLVWSYTSRYCQACLFLYSCSQLRDDCTGRHPCPLHVRSDATHQRSPKI